MADLRGEPVAGYLLASAAAIMGSVRIRFRWLLPVTSNRHPVADDSTSPSLLRRAKAQDDQAWRRLAALYGPLVYQWCRDCRLQASDAADVVQEVFRTVAQSIDRFHRDQPGDSFRGWLWTVTRNKLRDYQRREARQLQGTGGTTAHVHLQELPDSAPGETDESSRLHVHAQISDRALELMKTDFEESTWQAFWKTAVEGKTAPQAAEELGISVPAVYMAKSRVLRRLREELDGLDLIE